MPYKDDSLGVTGDFDVGGKLSSTGGILPRVVTLTDGATINTNSDVVDIGILTSLSQTSTFANPTGTPVNGQRLQYRITSSVSRLLLFGTAFQSTVILLPVATTGGSKEDYLDFQYNSTDSKWDIVRNTIAFLNSDDAIALIIGLG